MRTVTIFFTTLFALVMLAVPVSAQNVWPTPAGPTTVGVVIMCLDGTGKAIPIGPSCANPIPVTGGGSGGGGAPYAFTPLSPGQHNVAVASSTALTIPATATYATICVSTGNVNYTTDGTTTPTGIFGQPILAGQCEPFSGPTVLANFRAIQQSGYSATISVEYFK